eukprot:545897-Amorphochlora_amoeboformis.AAC.1
MAGIDGVRLDFAPIAERVLILFYGIYRLVRITLLATNLAEELGKLVLGFDNGRLCVGERGVGELFDKVSMARERGKEAIGLVAIGMNSLDAF